MQSLITQAQSGLDGDKVEDGQTDGSERVLWVRLNPVIVFGFGRRRHSPFTPPTVSILHGIAAGISARNPVSSLDFAAGFFHAI